MGNITIQLDGRLQEMDEAKLVPFTENWESEDERGSATGYTLEGVVVQRSVTIHLKNGINLAAEIEGFN